MKTLLIKNATVITLGEKNRVLPQHSVLIEGEHIKKIAPDKDIQVQANEEIDAKGMLLMPGFINAHMHFYSSFARGLGKANPSKNFGEVLENLWWRLDKKLTLEDSYYSTMVACVDAIKRGTTTLIDHHASPHAVTGSLKSVAGAILDAGLRGNLCYELSDRDGARISREGIEENIEFIRHCQENPNDHLRALFGLHASFTLEDDTLKSAVEEAKKYKAGFHVHCAEDISDQEITFKKTGKRVVRRLNDLGILGPQTILGHCIHLDDEELDLVAKSGSMVVHNPQSNMNNAVGVANVNKMLSKGILVGLGTDAMTVNMLEELRSALWINHLSNKNPSVGFMECTGLLTQSNAKIANRFWTGLGEIREGHKADIILMDYHAPTPFDENTFLGHLVFGFCNGVVDSTIVAGKVLMKHKHLMGIDEERVAHRSRELAQKLWERF